ncbi:hypothetical protein EYF80_015482 [Liparis tanakae]|uniref:Uncharacterized protein n=1 Tax=Liparis tanakae TaxID=230148 RepID=A0A4Z2I852_9TELE|nr:hypothetical protein EYF80_015482 [Liparis tanakae]
MQRLARYPLEKAKRIMKMMYQESWSNSTGRGSPNLQKVRGGASWAGGGASWAERRARVSASVLTHMQTAVRLLPAQSIKLKRRKHDTGMK